MRKFLITTAVAAATLAVAAPATAQYRGNDHRGGWGDRDDRGHRGNDHRGGWGDRDDRDHRGHYGQQANRQAVNQLLRDLDRVESRIQRSAQRGTISQREAHSLRREAANIRQRIYRATRNGLSQGEFMQLRQRVSQLEQRVRYERRDRDDRRW